MLLIYPPTARGTEPPLGIARLAAYIQASGGGAECLDLSAEGFEYLMGGAPVAPDSPGRNSLRRRWRAASSLASPEGYANRSRYTRAVDDLARSLRIASAPFGVQVGLTDYRDDSRSPLRKGDLVRAGREFEDNVFFPLFEERVAPALASNRDGWIGISICYLSQALCGLALAGYAKSRRPGTKVVLGGGLVTSWIAGGAMGRDETFGGLADAAIAGPGEIPLAQLLGLGEARGGEPLDLRGFEDNRYLSPGRVVPYNFSSGCPWKRCTFCPERAEDMPYSGIPPAEAARRVERLGELFSPALFHLTDSELSAPYLEALAESPPPARWYGFARFSTRLADPGFCRRLAASGCAMLQLGLESGDQEVLDRMGKGTKLEEISVILDNLAEAGIAAYLYVLFGTPAEDRSAALRTRDFVAARADRIGFLNLAVFNLPASSPEARSLETRSFFEGDLGLYKEFRHPSGWDRPEVRRFIAEDFESVPEIRAIARRTPAVFNSSHAPFLLDAD